MQKLMFFLLFPMVLFSCKKEAGVGGSATIKGKVSVSTYNGTIPTGITFDGPDYDVYIIYGGTNTFYDDKITTSYDGSFEFRYLRKGDYKIFVYSRDVFNAVDGDWIPVFSSATITNNNETIELDPIEINDKQ